MTSLLVILTILSIIFLVVMLSLYSNFMSEIPSSTIKYKISFKQFYDWYQQNKNGLCRCDGTIGFYHKDKYYMDIRVYVNRCNILDKYYFFSFFDFVQYELFIIWHRFFDKYMIDKSKYIDKSKGENPLITNTK